MSKARVGYCCPVCHETGPARSLVVVPSGVELTCGACGVATRFPPYEAIQAPGVGTEASVVSGVTAPTPAPPAAENDTGFDDSTSPSRLTEDDPRIAAVVAVSGMPEDLLVRYRDAVREGDTPVQHEAVLKHAVASSQIEAVGLIYKHRGLALPGDEVARVMRDRVIAVAMTLLAVKTDPEEAKRQLSWASGVFAALFLLGAVGFLVLVLTRNGCSLAVPAP
ncbi:MAG: hypothetical protein ABIJ09_20175 [Pseudomonadota bacterium]